MHLSTPYTLQEILETCRVLSEYKDKVKTYAQLYAWCRNGIKTDLGNKVFLKHTKGSKLIHTTFGNLDEFLAKVEADHSTFRQKKQEAADKKHLQERERKKTHMRALARARSKGLTYTVQVAFYMTENQKKILDQNANAAGVSVAEFIRSRCCQEDHVHH